MRTITRLPSAQDRSINFVDTDDNGYIFESRYVRPDDHYIIVYLSSHTGCAMGCKMCHLTSSGQTTMFPASRADFIRQAELVLQHYRESDGPRASLCSFNFMARGEALANVNLVHGWDTVATELADMAWQHGLLARFNVSTVMPDIPTAGQTLLGWRTFQPTIYYSLYSVHPGVRQWLLPKAMDPHKALAHLKRYQELTDKVVKIHFPWIQGLNDSPVDIRAMASAILTSGLRVEYNCVRYNPPDSSQESPDFRELTELLGLLLGCPFKVVERVGVDVAASCGVFVEKGTYEHQ